MSDIDSKNLLLVEQDSPVSGSWTFELEALGYSVKTVRTAEQAIEAAGKIPDIDLVLMDIDLGEGACGVDAAKRILAKQDLPLVFILSNPDTETLEKVESITSYGFVTRNSSAAEWDLSIKIALRLFEVDKNTRKELDEHKQAENNLRDNNAQFRRFYENATIGMYRTAPDGKILMSNPALTKMLGFNTFEEVLQRNLSQEGFDSSCPRDKFREQILKYGTVHDLESVWIHKSGKKINISEHAWLVRDKNGNPLFYEGFIHDITERKRAEENLRKTQLTVDESPLSIFWISPEGKFIYVNKKAANKLGYSQDELLSMHVWDVDPNYPKEKRKEQWNLHRQAGGRIVESDHMRRDGSTFPVRINIYHLDFEDLEMEVAEAEDITERKQHEKKIRENESRLQSLVRIIQYQSESEQDFLDYALKEAIQLTNSKIGYIYFYDEDNREFTLNTWSKGVMDVCTIIEPLTVYQLDNTGMWGEAVRQRKEIVVNDFQAPDPYKKGYPKGHAPLYKYLTIPIFFGDRIVAVVGVANKENDYDQSDVMQLKVLMDGVWKEVEGKRAKKVIQKSLKEKEVLLSEIHHRVKNNMAIISSLLTLQTDFADRKKAPDKLLRDIQTRIESMALVHEMVYENQSFAEIEAGKLLKRLADYLKNIYSPEDKEITIGFRAEAMMLDMNRSIPFILLSSEVITNAWKHAFAGRNTGRIDLSLEKQKKGFRLVIQDNGVGVADLGKLNRPESFGYTIIHGLAKQLRAELSYSTPPEGGLRMEARFVD